MAASVIGRDPNTFYCFTIDQGTNAGISVNDPVVTDEGVVGWVSAVNSISAKVTTLLSPDTKIGGLTESAASHMGGAPESGFGIYTGRKRGRMKEQSCMKEWEREAESERLSAGKGTVENGVLIIDKPRPFRIPCLSGA